MYATRVCRTGRWRCKTRCSVTSRRRRRTTLPLHKQRNNQHIVHSVRRTHSFTTGLYTVTSFCCLYRKQQIITEKTVQISPSIVHRGVVVADDRLGDLFRYCGLTNSASTHTASRQTSHIHTVSVDLSAYQSDSELERRSIITKLINVSQFCV